MTRHGFLWFLRAGGLLLAGSLAAFAQFTEAPGSPFPAGSSPHSVAAGDFNRDGNQDLAIANFADGTVTVLLGDGTGGFTAAAGSPFAAGSHPIYLALGDFNGDGKPDLAIANPPSNTVTLLLGNGTGGFTAAPGSPFPAGADPVSLAVGDFNGDGNLDLAIADSANANIADSAVTLLLGNGSGGFAASPASPFEAGYYPDALAVGDFNRDGKLDLAVGDYSGTVFGGTLTVLLGDGKGGFTANLLTRAGLTPWSLAVGDFNGDGKPDLAVGDRDGYLTLALGDGTGGFEEFRGGILGFGGTLYSLAAADFNADGQMDLAIAHYCRTYPYTDTLIVLLGDGAGGFTAAPGSPFVLGTDIVPISVAVGDFNGDGKPDLAVANAYANSVSVFLNSNPSPSLPTLISPSNGATGVPLAPTLSWNASSGATSYDVYLGTSASPPLVTETVETTYAPGPLGAGALYFWRVVAKNGGGSSTSATWSFTTQMSAPPAPTLSAPASGATGVLLTPTLSWNASAGATSYDVYFGTEASPPLVGDTAGTSYFTGTLSPGATYYWRVVATNSFGSASSVTSSFTTGVPVTGLRFVAVPPCRVVDTRSSGGPLTGGSSRSFAIPQSACSIPSTAQAYSFNVTAVPHGPLPYLTLWPTGEDQPLVSTLNSFKGEVVANAAIVPAGTNGAVSVYAAGLSDVVLDINGYFDASTGPSSYSFYPAAPCRVADTRNSAGPFGGPEMTSGQSRDFAVPVSACGMPFNVGAYSLNVTVVPDPAADYLGYLTTWPAGQAQPNVSTLNSWTGKVVANAAIVPAGANGSISVYVTDPTNVILDTNGYFGGEGGAGALSFYPVTPCRVADTRNAEGAFGGPVMAASSVRSFAIPEGGCGIPATAAAYSLNVTVVPEGPLYYLTAWPAGQAQPFVSTLNSWDGVVVANAAIVPAGTDGAVSVYVTDQTHVILDINGYFVL